ncbi:MAG: gliding motility-associated C-terminal domain-containing protein [Sphingobacteriales bacterium]
MFYKRILLLFFLIALSVKAFSAVFVVTSNADSGPGTLREALTLAAANGNAVKDYINFNIADTSVAGRTITLLSNLPAITSDMVIDGSTQPGTLLSVNGAKVIVGGSYTAQNSYIDYFLIQSVNSVEIDGLIIKSFFPEPYDIYNGVAAIIIDGNNKTITLGQPGKGNVIYNCSEALQCAVGEGAYFRNKSSTENFICKNNFVGVKEDGIATDAGNSSSQFVLNFVYNATVGGDTKAEGNVFYAITALSPSYGTNNFSENANYTIKNNIFGANAHQQTTNINDNNYLSIGVDPNLTYNQSTAISITDNVFGYALAVNGFQLLNLQIQRNFFGVSSDLKNKLPINPSAIVLTYMQGTILVGGTNTSEGNIFTNCAQSNDPTTNFIGVVQVSTFSPTVGLDPLFDVELSHNSFYCNNGSPFIYNIAPDKKPLGVTVDNLTPTSVSGTTKPNARVELFYTDKECTQCQPKTFITSTNADANGKWAYNAPLEAGYGVMAGATLDHVSSEFTDTRIYYNQSFPIVINAECNVGGSITGIYTVNAKTVEWLDSANNVVGTNLDLLNVPPGKYRLKADQFGCVAYSETIQIFDYSPKIDSQYVHIVNPSCGNGGSITNLNVAFGDKYAWLDAHGNIKGTQLDINNLSAGAYTLQVTGQRGCVKTYGPIILKNISGPNIDQSKSLIQSTNCGQSTGSITNLVVTGTGTLKYIWWNDQQQTVSTTQDLTGQPAGTYKLEVTDDSQCGPVYSSAIVIPETNGIILDESKALTTIASCSKDNGSVTGIVASGATQYQWTDANNKMAGTTADLKNAAPGDYILTTSNSFGCSKTSKTYHIGQQAPTQFPVYAAVIVPACTGKSNGTITVATDVLVNSARWVNSQGVTTGGKSAAIIDLAAGTYQLFLTDQNGCENLYNSYVVTTIPQLQIIPGSEQVTNDQCALKTGSITNIQVTGGVPPYTYTWLNAGNSTISSAPNLTGVGEGLYTLNVNDASNCGLVSTVYQVKNQDNIIPAPLAGNVQLCSPGDALLQVTNPSAAYSYRLYTSETSATPVDEQANGSFKITVKANGFYYVSQVSGDCESTRTAVQASVGITSLDIANAFTPNGDGINDFWKINGIANYPAAKVQVFTRSGQKVFESKGYTTPFDGTYNGKQLPVGVYYYIINLGTNCNLLSGSLTIIR